MTHDTMCKIRGFLFELVVYSFTFGKVYSLTSVRNYINLKFNNQREYSWLYSYHSLRLKPSKIHLNPNRALIFQPSTPC